MITPEIRAEIRRLVLRDGWKIETVARRFGVHHSVVRRMIRDSAPLDGRRAPKGWGTLFHNNAAASAIADRLVHKGLLVRIKGKSRRSEQDLDGTDDAA